MIIIGCLFCINLVAMTVGGTMAGFGAWMLSAGTSLYGTLGSLDGKLVSGISIGLLTELADRKGHLRKIAIAVTVIGCLVMAVASLGIVALLQRSSFLGIVYKFAVFMVLAGHIAGTALLLYKKPTLMTDIRNALLDSQKNGFVARTANFNKEKKLTKTLTKFFEHMHMSLECCGVVTSTDITNSSSFRKSIKKDSNYTALLPKSCCKLKNKAAALGGKKPVLVDSQCQYNLNSSSLHKQPCIKPMKSLFDKIILPVLVSCGVLAVVLATTLGLMAVEMCSGRGDSESDSDDDDSDSD